jgi:hypothetical protein
MDDVSVFIAWLSLASAQLLAPQFGSALLKLSSLSDSLSLYCIPCYVSDTQML